MDYLTRDIPRKSHFINAGISRNGVDLSNLPVRWERLDAWKKERKREPGCARVSFICFQVYIAITGGQVSPTISTNVHVHDFCVLKNFGLLRFEDKISAKTSEIFPEDDETVFNSMTENNIYIDRVKNIRLVTNCQWMSGLVHATPMKVLSATFM